VRDDKTGGPQIEKKTVDYGRRGGGEKTFFVPKLALKDDGKADVRDQDELLAAAPVGTRITFGVREGDHATVDNTLKMGPDTFSAHEIEPNKSGYYTRRQVAEHVGPNHGRNANDVFITLIEVFDLPPKAEEKDDGKAAPPEEPAGKDAPPQPQKK